MVERKKKTCKACGEETYLYARGMCLPCDRKETPHKHGLKPSGGTSPKKEPIPKKRKRIAPVSEKQARRLKEYRKLRDAYLKDNPVCEMCGTSNNITLHHGRGRIGELLFDTEHFHTLCIYHHRWVEEHPKASKELGLSSNRNLK